MELAPTPHPSAPRAPRRLLLGVLAVLLVALTALVLAPLALGLHHVVIRDGAMGSTWRGAVAIEEVKPGRDLGVGNVITFRPPGTSPGAPRMTRRVVSIVGATARTRADGATHEDPWRLQLDRSSYSRVVVRAPWVGRVVTGRGPLVAAGVLAALVLLVGAGRQPPRRRGRRVARLSGTARLG